MMAWMAPKEAAPRAEGEWVQPLGHHSEALTACAEAAEAAGGGRGTGKDKDTGRPGGGVPGGRGDS